MEDLVNRSKNASQARMQPIEGCCGAACPNVGQTERLVSGLVGGTLAAGGIRHLGSLSGLMLVSIGSALLFRSVTGYCSMYDALGVSTVEPPAKSTGLGALQDEQLAKARKMPDEVLDSSVGSFPASDPPSWTATAATRSM